MLVHDLVNVTFDSYSISVYGVLIWVCTKIFGLEACQIFMDFVQVSAAVLVDFLWSLLVDAL